jgi:hypothetical protein
MGSYAPKGHVLQEVMPFDRPCGSRKHGRQEGITCCRNRFRRIGSRGFGAREVLLQGSYYEVSLALVGVASLAFFYYTI